MSRVGGDGDSLEFTLRPTSAQLHCSPTFPPQPPHPHRRLSLALSRTDHRQPITSGGSSDGGRKPCAPEARVRQGGPAAAGDLRAHADGEGGERQAGAAEEPAGRQPGAAGADCGVPGGRRVGRDRVHGAQRAGGPDEGGRDRHPPQRQDRHVQGLDAPGRGQVGARGDRGVPSGLRRQGGQQLLARGVRARERDRRIEGLRRRCNLSLS